MLLTRLILYFVLMLKKSKRKYAHHLMDKAQGAINKCYLNKICPLIFYSPSCYFLIASRKFFLFTSRHLFIGMACFKYVSRRFVIYFVTREILQLRDLIYHTSLPTISTCLHFFFCRKCIRIHVVSLKLYL